VELIDFGVFGRAVVWVACQCIIFFQYIK